MILTLTPLIFNLGPTELIIILVIVLLLFGGSRLAGLGKSSGRALKEFKEETRGLRDDKSDPATPAGTPVYPPQQVTNGQSAPGYPPQQANNGQAAPNAYPPAQNSLPAYPPASSNPADPNQR